MQLIVMYKIVWPSLLLNNGFVCTYRSSQITIKESSNHSAVYAGEDKTSAVYVCIPNNYHSTTI